MGYTEQFDEELHGKVNGDRMEVYGHPLEDFNRVADMRKVIDQCSDPVMRHILGQVAVKVARLVHTPDDYDSWLDIAGYARTAVMCMDKRDTTLPDVSVSAATETWPRSDHDGRPNFGPAYADDVEGGLPSFMQNKRTRGDADGQG